MTFMTITEAWGTDFGELSTKDNTIHEERTHAPLKPNKNEEYNLNTDILLSKIYELENQLKDRVMTENNTKQLGGGFAGINFDALNLNNISTLILIGYFLIFIIDLVMNKKD